MSRPAEGGQKLLVVTLSNIGDVILTMPVLESLRRSFPGARLDVIAGPAAAALFEKDPRVTKFIAYNKKMSWADKLGLLRAVRAERYDVIVDLRRSLLGLLGGARLRNSYWGGPGKKTHRALRHLSALKNIASPAANGSFLEAEPWTGAADADIRRLVAAAVGSKSDIKKWPAASFAALLDRLILQDNCRVVLVGDAKDASDARKVMDLMQSQVLDLCGKTSLKELASVIKASALLITNDSAPLHLADALKTPTLAIFGPTDPDKYGPRFGRSAVARRVLFCSPCEKAQCRYQHECLTELGADQVYRQALFLLNDEFSKPSINILVTRLDRIGDVVLTLPAIAAIKKRFPNSRISLMTRPYTSALVQGHPLIDEVIPYFYEGAGRHRSLIGNLRFVREIIERRFDAAFILHPSHRSHLVPFLAGIPYRIGLRSGLSSLLLTAKVTDKRHEGKKHESEYTLDIIRAFGIEPGSERAAQIPVYADQEKKIEDLLQASSWGGRGRFIAFHLGASCPSKRWPKDAFLRLGRKVLDQTSFGLVIIGGEEDRPAASELCAGLGRGALDLTGKLDLKELAALLKKSELLVSNDTGPVHVAAAVGTRTLTIFGRNRAGLSATRWKALGPGHEQIQKDVGCVVCLAHRCSIDFECLKAVKVDEVFEKLEEMLAASVKV